MLEIKVNDTHTVVSIKAESEADYLIDFSNAVSGFAYSIHKSSGEDMHKILKELGLLVLAISDEDDDNPSFNIQEDN